MKTFEVKPDIGPNVNFNGELRASVSSEREGAQFWTVLECYSTKGGKTVVITRGVPADRKMKERTKIEAFNSDEDMTDKIGTGTLAMRLYREIGLNSVNID